MMDDRLRAGWDDGLATQFGLTCIRIGMHETIIRALQHSLHGHHPP